MGDQDKTSRPGAVPGQTAPSSPSAAPSQDPAPAAGGQVGIRYVGPSDVFVLADGTELRASDENDSASVSQKEFEQLQKLPHDNFERVNVEASK